MREKKYSCMTCPSIKFKASEWYLALQHLWSQHGEFTDRWDLPLFFYVNGEDLSGRNE